MSLAAYASETNEKHTRRHNKDGMQAYRFQTEMTFQKTCTVAFYQLNSNGKPHCYMLKFA